MDSHPEQNENLLHDVNSTPSTISIGSNSTIVASPSSPVHHRPGFQRANTIPEPLAPLHESPLSPSNTDAVHEGHGLGISMGNGHESISIPRKPVGSMTSVTSPKPPDSLLSPTLVKFGGKTYRSLESQDEREGADDTSHYTHAPSLHQTFAASSEVEGLRPSGPFENARGFDCKTKRSTKLSRGSVLAVTILILSIYTTVFSGIWIGIAIEKPHYGHTIATAGKISPNTASLLYAAFAKSIELSFVTVFVAFLGQVLSSRAIDERKKGITIAEMSMRSWVTQPGIMITHAASVRYAAGTFLGAFALLAALMAMLYTTASDALVAPKLKFGKTEHKVMYGQVASSFANKFYIEAHCTTPIQEKIDPLHYQETCIQIQHAGEAYHNYMQYLGDWAGNIGSGNGSTNMAQRPDPVAVSWYSLYLKESAD